MLKLSQLKISPAPWTNKLENGTEWNSVWDEKNGGVLSGGYVESVNDARLIAAAPELYEALLDAVGTCHDCTKDCSDCLSHRASWMPKARAALAKASGESEDN